MITNFLPKKILKFFKIGIFNPNNYEHWEDRVDLSSDTIITNPHNVYFGGNNGLKRAIIMTTNAKFVMKKNSGASYGLVVLTGNHARVIGTPYRCITEDIKPKGLDSDVIIEEDCWIGVNVTILSGVTISRGSTVGAGAVVTKSMPPYCVCGGVPAKFIKFYWTIDEILEHEAKLYSPQERLSREYLESIFEKFSK